MKFLSKFSVKTYMSAMLLALLAMGAAHLGYKGIAAHAFLSVFSAIATELILGYLKSRRIVSVSSAFIAGMIVALVLSPQTEWFIVMAASSIAIAQKYIIRYRDRHIFNPANFGLLAVVFIFSSHPTWWVMEYWPFIVSAGIFICYRMRRITLPLVFLLIFSLLFVLNNVVAGLYPREWLLFPNMFFIFVMLIEPKTSPLNQKGLIIYGILTALFGFAFFKLLPQHDFSLISLALVNLTVPFLNRLNKELR